jgi:hypothetical protein
VVESGGQPVAFAVAMGLPVFSENSLTGEWQAFNGSTQPSEACSQQVGHHVLPVVTRDLWTLRLFSQQHAERVG